MKIKEDILKWRKEIRELTEKISKFETDTKSYYTEVQELKEQVVKLANITEEMTEAMLTLIRQQIGD